LEAMMEAMMEAMVDPDSKFQVLKTKSQGMKPRSNLASAYRLASHGGPTVNEKIHPALLEVKISFLEKIVDSLKQFMFMIILIRGRAKN